MTEPAPPPEGDVRADVVVVGGGYTGMWCAWHLLETAPDARIVLLEADLCGHGPSGRNGGFCHGTWLSLDPLRDRLGAGPALELARATQAGAEAIGRWCDEQGVDAWYRRGGELRVSTTEAHDDVGLASARAADELGVGDRLVDLTPAQVREHCDSPVFRRGVYAPDGATVHPGRLALGLRARLIDRGVVVHEHARVLRVRGEGAAGVSVETAGARIRAGHAVLAAGGALARMPAMRGRVLVGSSHLIVTEPVPDVIEALGWGGEAISDARAFLHYTRTTDDGRIAFGWAGGRPAFGGRLRGRVEVDPAVAEALHRHLLRWFPMLEGRAIEHAWASPCRAGPTGRTPVNAADGRPEHSPEQHRRGGGHEHEDDPHGRAVDHAEGDRVRPRRRDRTAGTTTATLYLQRFEKAFADYLGDRFALATSSCTGALHLALLGLGVGPGDEVLVPEITWIATASAVAYAGATPVFVDVDPDTWCMDPPTPPGRHAADQGHRAGPSLRPSGRHGGPHAAGSRAQPDVVLRTRPPALGAE